MIFELDIINQDAWLAYREVAGPLMEAAGARFILRSERIEPLEGGWNPPSLSVVEFPSFEAAHDFYHSQAYKATLPLREKASRGRGVLVESSL
ncbi:DUF1330 domain-containing protein [Mesorhizobium sp. CAU 1741]|uniref:DUF1330 domain-containing protein n=1 Tax=Mesorhizobium sp. CAU 1741 TaxID=3140366 RepID=UPI00325A73CB